VLPVHELCKKTQFPGYALLRYGLGAVADGNVMSRPGGHIGVICLRLLGVLGRNDVNTLRGQCA
jgi:hypothetical protein